ncbi:MAG: hypothetical protein EHM28_00860 [Spirochaetaceae bacterium]|nr:MAG: hypothetical protein EHM28_00860 [Spirochaetaceae bacterium]
MFRPSKVMLLFLAWTVLLTALAADDEASDAPVVFADQHGCAYARSIPDSLYGNHTGKTYIYLVGTESDTLIETYNWYSRRIYVVNHSGDRYIVRTGPWQRGREANTADLSIGFYRNGKIDC